MSVGESSGSTTSLYAASEDNLTPSIDQRLHVLLLNRTRMIGAVILLAMTLRSVRNDSVCIRPRKPITNEVTELAAVFTDSAVDRRDRGHGSEAVAVGDGITIAERSREFGSLERDIFLIDALAVEVDKILERTEIGRVAVDSSSVFDVVEDEFVFSCGCHSGSCGGSSALETAVAVSARVFLTTIRLDEALVEASDELLEDSGLKLNLGKRFSERGER